MDRYDHRHDTKTNRQCVYREVPKGENMTVEGWIIVAQADDEMPLGQVCRMDHSIRFINKEYEGSWELSPGSVISMSTSHTINFNVTPTTDDAVYIVNEVLPALLDRFLKKNTKYARAQVHDLGIKGIVPDINRKSSVIIDRIWHGAGVIDEDTEEVIDDLIGHLLLMRAKMRSR